MNGDFNDIMGEEENVGGATHPRYLIEGFREVLRESVMHDVQCNGHNYTWERGWGVDNWVRERLDRAVANSGWHAPIPWLCCVYPGKFCF